MPLSDFKRWLFGAALLAGLAGPACAQGTLYFNCIAGGYSMRDLKRVQGAFATNAIVPASDFQNVMNFPVSLQGELEFKYRIRNRFLIGGYTNYAITRGKSAYADYSGELTATQNLSRVVNGIVTGILVGGGFSFYLKGGLCFSGDKIVSTFRLNGSGMQSDSEKFHSLGYVVQPGFAWSHRIASGFSFQAQGGYEYNVQGITHYNNDSKQYLVQPRNGHYARINWTGFRLGAGIGYTF